MNSSDICHQISDCPGLFVDAFKGRFLREHTKDPNATFVLSHYHGDHYTQLPRDFKYKGPAKIHCSPVTARLLVDVHLVSKDLVVEHEYGSTFSHSIHPHFGKGGDDTHANITFYDANHCPGACIILIALPESKTVHLHTGDMRYHPRFQKYPLLAQATLQRKLDLVYLDTTYCHPKHDFLAQEDAVDTIATQTQDLLSRETESKTLVLLSCYSIGKEKVLLEASKRSNQKIYVSEKKWKMLRCIQPQESSEKTHEEQHESTVVEDLNNILSRCTRDPSESDLHVIPMGLAGEMWPYFQPNFQKLAKYVEDLSLNHNMVNAESAERQPPPKEYERVVAFIPTGWADATNWNKKNAISTKTVKLPSSSRSLHVEVRLISYSEHSTFSELVSFVQYLKPRKVIPTVYGDASHKRQIEGRFRNMLDSNRAKQAFFRSMTKTRSSPIPVKNEAVPSSNGTKGNTKSSPQSEKVVCKEKCDSSLLDDDEGTVDEIEVVRVVPSKESPGFSDAAGSTQATMHHDEVDTLVSMGFDRYQAQAVLKQCQGNMERAIHQILSGDNAIPAATPPQQKGDSSISSSNNSKNEHQNVVKGQTSQSPPTAAAAKKRKISDFFRNRKASS